MDRHWVTSYESDSFGLELYRRLSQEQRIEYNTLIAKAEIDSKTATCMEGIFAPAAGETPLSVQWSVRIERHWKSYYDTWLLARAVLMGATLSCERGVFIHQYFKLGLGQMPSPQIPLNTDLD